MEKRNCDKSKAKLLAVLEPLTSRRSDCLRDDFGLWESLCADMLSADETARFAEHLDVCEECRQECAIAYATGVYEDSPLYDRLRAFEENPEAETDEDWKKIAIAFNPELANVRSAEAVAETSRTVDEPSAEAVVETSRTVDEPSAEPRTSESWSVKKQTNVRWRILSYSASAAIWVASAAIWVATALVWMTPEPEPPCYLAMVDDRNAEQTALENAASPQRTGGARNIGELAPPSDIEPKAASPQRTGNKDDALDSLYPLDNLKGDLGAIAGNGVEYFDVADYKTAAEEFGKLIERAEEILNLVYWNRAVATWKSGELEDAENLFKALKARNLSPELSEKADAALEELAKEKELAEK